MTHDYNPDEKSQETASMADLSSQRFAQMLERKQRQSPVGDPGGASDASEWLATPATTDGRISTSADDKGYVQLNVRIHISLKMRILLERERRRKAGAAGGDVGDIVEEALDAFLTGH